MEEQLKGMEERLKKEIMEEIASLGAKVIPSSYDAGNELLKLSNDFDKTIEKYNKEVSRINEIYSSAEAQKRISELETDNYIYKQEFEEKIDKVLEKDRKYRIEASKNKQTGAEYKENKRDIINTCIALGHSLDAELTAELIKPFIEAKDIFTLKLLKKAITKDTWVLDAAIREVEEYYNNSLIKSTGQQLQLFSRNGSKNKPYTLQNLLYMLKNS